MLNGIQEKEATQLVAQTSLIIICVTRLRRRSVNSRKRCSSLRTTSIRPRRSWWPQTRGSRRKRRPSRTWVKPTLQNTNFIIFLFFLFCANHTQSWTLWCWCSAAVGAWTTNQAKEEVEALEKKMQQLENELAQTQANLEQATHNLEEKEKALQNVSLLRMMTSLECAWSFFWHYLFVLLLRIVFVYIRVWLTTSHLFFFRGSYCLPLYLVRLSQSVVISKTHACYVCGSVVAKNYFIFALTSFLVGNQTINGFFHCLNKVSPSPMSHSEDAKSAASTPSSSPRCPRHFRVLEWSIWNASKNPLTFDRTVNLV